MGVPQDSRTRRIQKKRRTKKLALWREQHKQPEPATAGAEAPKKTDA
jgi:hypothetical protein